MYHFLICFLDVFVRGIPTDTKYLVVVKAHDRVDESVVEMKAYVYEATDSAQTTLEVARKRTPQLSRLVAHFTVLL